MRLAVAVPLRGEMRVNDVARAVAALMDTDLVEDGQAFDPDWSARRNAEQEATDAAAFGA
jgi:hypothetical protein